MSLIIYLGRWDGDPVHAYTFDDITSHATHGVLREGLPTLSLKVEDDFAQFSSGSLTFTVNDVDAVASTVLANLDPYARYPYAPWIDVVRDGRLRWRGVIDPRSVVIDTKDLKCSFTAVGMLATLDQFSAEGVKRDVPDQADCGTGVGISGRLTDTTKTWKKSQFLNHVLIDSLGDLFTCLEIVAVGDPDLDYVKVTGTPASGPYRLRPYVWKTCEDSGSHGVGTLLHLTDASKAWATWPGVNGWHDYYLHDSTGAVFTIDSNTDHVLTVTSGTPATGKYSIRAASHARLMESLGPAVADLAILPDDTLLLTCANLVGIMRRYPGPDEDPPPPKTVWSLPRYGVETQAVQVQYVGPRVSNPTLTDHEIWLKDDLLSDFNPGDGCVNQTPYYRDKTVAELVALLAAEAGFSQYVNVETFATNNIVPYADFAEKSIGAALVELATIVNASVLMDYRGAHPGIMRLVVNRRDAAYPDLVKYLGYIAPSQLVTRDDTTSYEHWYDSVRVAGAEGREVMRGVQRFGGQVLDVSSDHVTSYTWLHQIAARLAGFFLSKRKVSKVRVSGDYRHPQLYWFASASPVGAERDFIDAWVTYATWALLGSPQYLTCTAGYSPSAALYVPIAAVADADIIAVVESATNSDYPGIGLRVTWASGRNGYFAVIDPGNNQLALIKWVANVGTYVGLPVDITIDFATKYYLRFRAVGSDLKAKVWKVIDAEPGAWTIERTDATLAGASCPAIYCAMNNPGGEKFYEFGVYDTATEASAGWGLLDRVVMDDLVATGEWTVIGVEEPLEEPIPHVDLTLLQATGEVLTPADAVSTRDTSRPDPPVITGIVRDNGAKTFTISYTWDGPLSRLLGFYITRWTATDPRPDAGGWFIAADWSTDHWVYVISYSVMPTADTVYVDVQAVTLDGLTSDVEDPEYLP